MVVHRALPGLELSMYSAGKTLDEYDLDADETGSGNTIVKYVEATSGQPFRVELREVGHLDHDLALDVHLEGQWVASLAIYRSRSTGQRPYHIKGAYSAQADGSLTIRPFTFAELSTTDAEPGAVGRDMLDSIHTLGTIKVLVRRVLITGRTHVAPQVRPQLRDVGVIPEKALKGQAVSHTATLGRPESTSSAHMLNVLFIDRVETPFVVYEFRYRSMAALKSMLIVPRTPTPEPPVESARRDPATLSYDELLAIVRARDEQDAVQLCVKSENKRQRALSLVSDADPGASAAATNDQPRKRPRPAGNKNIAFIDLCDD